MMPMNLSHVAILNIKGSDYCCIISLISKNESINLMLILPKKVEQYKTKHREQIEAENLLQILI